MVNSVYNYLAVSQLIGHTPKSLSRFNATHQRSELKQIYNNIINLNNNAPLYLIKLSETNQNHALGLKEASMSLHAALADISTTENTSVFAYQKAYSENEVSASASIATDDYSRLPKPFQLKIDSLACSQVNSSIPLYSNSRGPAEGSYRFTINMEDTAYEFQFHISSDAKNQSVLTKLTDFINRTDIGIRASLKTNEANDQITMILESEATGTPDGLIFRLSDNNSSDKQVGLAEFYDLNHVVVSPKNSKFEINGEPAESISNNFTLNQALTISLHSPFDQSFAIGYTPDSEQILDGLENVLSAYNHLIDLADTYPSKQYLSSKLIHDIESTVRPFANQMESCGLSKDNIGHLVLDQSLAIQSIMDGEMKDLFTASDLVPSLMHKLDSITINPMEYVDKTIVTYPNTTKPAVGKAYITSMYSGMFFNYYC